MKKEKEKLWPIVIISIILIFAITYTAIQRNVITGEVVGGEGVQILGPNGSSPIPAIEVPSPFEKPVETSSADVKIINFAYSPLNLEVNVGDTVVWENRDHVKHTITSYDDIFDSGLIALSEKFSYTFNEAGSYEYYCVPHPYMKGRVVVNG